MPCNGPAPKGKTKCVPPPPPPRTHALMTMNEAREVLGLPSRVMVLEEGLQVHPVEQMPIRDEWRRRHIGPSVRYPRGWLRFVATSRR